MTKFWCHGRHLSFSQDPHLLVCVWFDLLLQSPEYTCLIHPYAAFTTNFYTFYSYFLCDKLKLALYLTCLPSLSQSLSKSVTRAYWNISLSPIDLCQNKLQASLCCLDEVLKFSEFCLKNNFGHYFEICLYMGFWWLPTS